MREQIGQRTALVFVFPHSAEDGIVGVDVLDTAAEGTQSKVQVSKHGSCQERCRRNDDAEEHTPEVVLQRALAVERKELEGRGREQD